MKNSPSYKYNNSFFEWKISKRNQLLKRVKENYVRNDIPCGFECCGTKIYDDFVVFTICSKEILEKHKSLLKSDFIRPIICQSEFNKLKMGEQKRIKDLIDKKAYIYFYDTFFDVTVNKGLKGVLEFYTSHLQSKKFIILSEQNIKDYAKYFEDNIVKDLVDDVFIREETSYDDYYTNLEILYSTGKILKSTLMVDTYNWRNGTIFCQNKRVRILGSKNMNRAIHGDDVYVEIIEEVCEDEIDVNVEDTNDFVTKKNKLENETNKNVLFGKVVGIAKREKTELIGTILNSTISGDGSQNVLVLPIDKRYPPIRIRTSQPDELVNRRLWIELEFWEKDSKYPTGHYFKKMSQIGDVNGEIECILLSNGVSYFNHKWIELIKPINYYNVETIKALNSEHSDFFSLKSMFQEIESGQRIDLRHLDVFSIDPQGCTDVDDALHITTLENGNFEIGVHIADVSHYVKPGSTLDEISSDRGTTVYLPNKRIDMLPEFLSAGLCSLLENQERGTFSVIWEIDKTGQILSTKFTKALIKSRKAFSYEEALKLLNSPNSAYLQEDISRLFEISKILREKRQKNGALDLSANKIEVSNNKIETKKPILTNNLIEEFMLLANISVAEFIYKNYPENAVLRKHPPPSESPMPIDVNLQDSFNINEVINSLDSNKKDVFKKIVTRAMNQAIYVLSSEDTDFCHYGLATPLYTHFTSPIRRYADILVHRTLYCILCKNSFSPTDNINHTIQLQKNEEISNEDNTCCSNGKRYKVPNFSEELSNINDTLINNLNKRHSNARRCSWDVTNLFIYNVIREVEPTTDAYVTDIKTNGVLIYIPDYGLNEALPLGDKEYNVFDRIKVKLLKNDEMFYYRRRFDIEIVYK